MSPYSQVKGAEAKAKGIILIRKHTATLTSLLPSIRRAHYAMAMVAFTAILAEFLVVVLSGLPLQPCQMQDEFFFCGVTALVILAVMILVIMAVNLWRKSLPQLPLKPDNVAAVMSYLSHSHMVKEFEGADKMKTRERNVWIEQLGKRYAYGQEEDGNRYRWIIDKVDHNQSQHHDAEKGWKEPAQQSWIQTIRK
jgi:hypothetical protein